MTPNTKCERYTIYFVMGVIALGVLGLVGYLILTILFN